MRVSISLDRTLAAVIAAYSVLFLWLHVLPPVNWAVDFVPVWGRVAMVAAYLATFAISVDRMAEASGRAMGRLAAGMPPAVRSLAWMTLVSAVLWRFRHVPLFGDGLLLLNLVTNGYRFDPHSPLGIFLQSLIFQAGHRDFGLIAEQTWAMTSVVWGLAFVPALTRTCREWLGEGRAAAVAIALIATQATTKFYFGYIEDYVAPSVLVLLYVRASRRALRGETSIVVPGLLFGLTLLFSMAYAFLLPSLAWLALEWCRGKDRPYLRFLWATSSCPALVLATLAGLHWIFGVDVIRLYASSHAANLSANSALSRYDGVWPLLLDLLSLHLAVAPFSLLFVVLLLLSSSARNALREPHVRFLAVLAACGLFMGVVWFPGLGMERDWDLFALFATPTSLLAACLLARSSAEPVLRPHVNRALVLTAIHTLFWIRA